MNTRGVVIIVLSIVLACLILSPFAYHLAAAEPAAAPAPPAGRYQFTVHPTPGGTADYIYVLDTQTGRVWYRSYANTAKGEWTDLGSPAVEVKK
jgi:hypothetical protein